MNTWSVPADAAATGEVFMSQEPIDVPEAGARLHGTWDPEGGVRYYLDLPDAGLTLEGVRALIETLSVLAHEGPAVEAAS